MCRSSGKDQMKLITNYGVNAPNLVSSFLPHILSDAGNSTSYMIPRSPWRSLSCNFYPATLNFISAGRQCSGQHRDLYFDLYFLLTFGENPETSSDKHNVTGMILVTWECSEAPSSSKVHQTGIGQKWSVSWSQLEPLPGPFLEFQEAEPPR